MKKDDAIIINYHHLNSELELFHGIPAIVFFFWIPTFVFLNIYFIIISSLLTVIAITLHKKGFSIKEMIQVVLYIKRETNPPLKKGE